MLTDRGIIGDSRREEGHSVDDCKFIVNRGDGVSTLMVKSKMVVMVG